MKLDNPNLTAYALGELSPAEQATLEPEIRAHREIAAEIEETREIAGLLRGGLAAELSDGLGEHQRDAIFREVELLQKERDLVASASTTATAEVFAPLVVPRSTVWERPGPWQAIAACAVAGFAAYALLVNPGRGSSGSMRTGANEILMPVPSDGGGATAKAGGPELVSPDVGSKTGSVGAVGLDALKNIASVPATIPGVQPSATLPDWRAGASVGRPEKKSATPADQDVSVYLKERMTEAGSLKEGSTYAEFSKLFRPSADAPGRFEMIRMPSIKVDAEFTTLNGQGLSGDSELRKISKPYLD